MINIVFSYWQIIANNSDSILNYFEETFREKVRGEVVVGKPEWYINFILV